MNLVRRQPQRCGRRAACQRRSRHARPCPRRAAKRSPRGRRGSVAGTRGLCLPHPLVTMEMTARQITNVAAPEGTHAPFGNLIKLREYPTAEFRDVTAPNADTLYTTAFLDVGEEPWLVSIPDFDDRYALFPMLDGWTTVFDVPASARPEPGRRPGGDRSGLERHAARRRHRVPFADEPRLAARPDSLHRDARGLCRGARAAGCDRAAAAQRLGQGGLDPPAGTVDPKINMKESRPRPGEHARRRRLLQARSRADEAQLHRPRRTRQARAAGADRHRRRRVGFRRLEARRAAQEAHPGAWLRAHHAALQGQRRRRSGHQRLASRSRPGSTAPTTCSARW